MLSRIRTLLILCAAAALLCVPARAQKAKASLYGTVTTIEDGVRKPLDYAVLVLRPAGVYATTDAEGKYSFEGLDPGSYDLSVQLIGYETVDTTLSVSGVLRKDIILKESNFRIEEVHVVAQASKAGDATASTISRQAMDHSQTSSLKDVMQLLPGVAFSNPDLSSAQSLNIRTASASDMNSLGVAVIVDGAPVSNNANMEGISTAINGVSSAVASTAVSAAGATPTGGIDVRSLSTDNIESVEVIRGIPSVQYGDLTSGAVIINSKAGAEPLTVRLKTDPKIYQAALSKGFRLPGRGGDIHISSDYAHSTAKTTEAYANYRRLNFKTMYTRRFGDLNSSFSLDLKYGKDVRDKNPDDERASLATGGTSYGARLSANGTWNINRGWLKTLRYDISGSYTGKHSWRDQDLTNAVAIYSTNMEDGTSVSNIKGGHVYDASGNELTTHSAGNMAYATMLPYFYFSHYDFYGKEINAFAKLTLNLYKNWGRTDNKILLGADFKTDGNLGEGLVFPEGTPPSHTGNTEAGFRPRPLYDIPFVNQIGVFAEDSFRTKLLGRALHLTAGARLDNIGHLHALAPRANASFELIPGALSLRGGYGITVKAPTALYLYPNNAYYDQININTSEAAAEKDRVVMATTYIYDTTNPDLRIAMNRKAEIGFDLTLAGRYKLGVTFYDERLKDGYGFGTSLQSWRLVPYKTYTISGHAEDGTPIFSPEYDTRRFFVYYMPMNNGSEHHRGVEFELNLGRFEQIRTSFYLNGAWIMSESTSTGYTFDMNMDHGSTILSNVGIYEPQTWTYFNERALTTLRATHNIPSLGFVVTLTTQFNLFRNSWTEYGDDLKPSKYISREDGQVYDFTDEMASMPEWSYMLDQRSDSRFIVSRTIPTVVFNFNLSKEVKNFLTASFYVNNFFNSRPLDPSEVTKGSFTELNNPMYFGFELKFKL